MNRDISYIWAAPLITAIRVLYSTSIAWMIVASAMGHGGFLAKVLNYSGFVHINKLSYGIYLLNPAVITVIYGAKDHSTHMEPITTVCFSFMFYISLENKVGSIFTIYITKFIVNY